MTDERAKKAEAIAAWEERAAIIQDGMPNCDRRTAEGMASHQLGYTPNWRGSIVNVIDAGANREERR